MRKLIIAAAVAAILPAGIARAEGPKLETDDQKTLYALGVALSGSLAAFDLSPDEVAVVQMGVSDGALGKEPKIDVDAQRAKFQELAQSRQGAAAAKEKGASKDFLAKAEKADGAVKTESGLIYKETKAGEGPSPKATDRVTVHYHGTLMDGTVFDSSKDRGEPATFPLNGVIPCWTEGVQKMKKGGTAQLICPSEIAYGDRGAPPKIKPGATLVFDVELIEIAEGAPAAQKPPGHP
ncbi:MAG: FKBP-type peptidyl-prolyl cis-trans isomerase [Candidatus Binatia bacterium]|nr:FKBP-type peptidyl-prolyl cis-trans isomerase [Candidatus Binatia bacterium]